MSTTKDKSTSPDTLDQRTSSRPGRTIALFASGVEKETLRFSGYEVDSVCRVLSEYYDTMKYGGSTCGIMYEVAAAFSKLGRDIISIYPTWLDECGYVAEFERVQKIEVNDLHQRKNLLLQDIECILCYPGGIGTLDELVTFLARAAVKEDLREIPVLLYNFDGIFNPFRLMLETFEVYGFAAATYAKLHYFSTTDQLRQILEQEYQNT
jgi:predicted Rossmann-fold nucleotide-binding protein